MSYHGRQSSDVSILLLYNFVPCTFTDYITSVFWHCWLGDRMGIYPVHNWVSWHGTGHDLTEALHVLYFLLSLPPSPSYLILLQNNPEWCAYPGYPTIKMSTSIYWVYCILFANTRSNSTDFTQKPSTSRLRHHLQAVGAYCGSPTTSRTAC